jgi:transcriptional regulator with XRE-family HTH domain
MDLRPPAEMLAEIKAATNMVETELATRIGISQPTVNRILRGQPNCTWKVLVAIQRLHAEVMSERAAATA